ncbi:2-hydroxyacid dehydrogenase [Anderseniella sp. Alg231-50]|uniref:2-hydroxyacid dehydrogenase n=1 Tax=Anderseniella sp. Alg231-50 TaxID=1922226 RepID=UPI00307C37E7
MGDKLKIVRTDRELECPLIDGHFRDGGAELVLLPDDVSEDELVIATQDADLLLMCYTPITERVFRSAARLKGVVKYGVGVDAIDFAAANAAKVPVVNIPEYAEETVAEGAFALMIALARKLVPLQRTMRRDGWVWPENAWLGSDVAGKTIGLVGVGRIGRSMARMAGAGFRARVIGYDPSASTDEMAAAGVEKVENLHEMLAQCDFVSVHSVLKPETRHLIGEAELRCMKQTAFLINSARGALVDEQALLAALKQNRIAGAGLDVFSQEPLSLAGHPLSELFEMDNVLLSPHLTFYTREAMARLELETLQRCKEILAGKPVLVKSRDSRLTSQCDGVVFAGDID